VREQRGVRALRNLFGTRVPSIAGSAATTQHPTATAPRHGLVVGIGDSITWGASTAEPPVTSYVAVAATMLGVAHVNLALDGAFTAAIAASVRRVAAHDALAVVNAGTNDVGVSCRAATPHAAVEAVRRRLPDADTLFAAIGERLPRARVIVVTVRDLGRAGAYYPDAPAESLTAAAHEWNARMRTLAAQHGATLIDLERSAEWYVRDEWDPSGIHPLATGTLRLARAVTSAAQPAT